MRFFAFFFAICTAVCGILWITDEPGSGMGYATAGFALIGGGTLLHNKVVNGGWLAESRSLNDKAADK